MSADVKKTHYVFTCPFIDNPNITGDGKGAFSFHRSMKLVILETFIVWISSKPQDTPVDGLPEF